MKIQACTSACTFVQRGTAWNCIMHFTQTSIWMSSCWSPVTLQSFSFFRVNFSTFGLFSVWLLFISLEVGGKNIWFLGECDVCWGETGRKELSPV